MSDLDDAAAVLEGFVPIGVDDPRVIAFEQSVLENIAIRPSPNLPPEPYEPIEDRLSRVESKLDELISLIRGGPT